MAHTPRTGLRFDLWEVFLLLAATVAVMLLLAPRYSNPVQSETELAYFQNRYGPDHFSEREEEWMIRDFFQDRRGGFFLDVGANHYQFASKTYYLETVLGWSGLAIEPQQQFAADYAAHRPRTKFFPFFVSDVSNETAKLYVLNKASMVASSNQEFVKLFGEPDEVREVPTISLNDLLAREDVTTVDFMSMDIELHEPQALKGLDLARYKPTLVCIEGLPPVRQVILDHFAANGYVLVGRYMWVDRENLYFTPLGNAPGPVM